MNAPTQPEPFRPLTQSEKCRVLSEEYEYLAGIDPEPDRAAGAMDSARYFERLARWHADRRE